MQSFISRNKSLNIRAFLYPCSFNHLNRMTSQYNKQTSSTAFIDAKYIKLDLEKYLPNFPRISYCFNDSINLFKSNFSLNSLNNQQNNQEKSSSSSDNEQDANKNNMRSPGKF
jgi:hypothetical protein